jgi:hypothetical protein
LTDKKLATLFESAQVTDLSKRLLYGYPDKYHTMADLCLLADAAEKSPGTIAIWPYSERLALTFDPADPTYIKDNTNDVKLTSILPLILRPDNFITIYEWVNERYGAEYEYQKLKALKFLAVKAFTPFFSNPQNFDMGSDDMEDFIDAAKQTIQSLIRAGIPSHLIFGSAYTMATVKQAIRDILAAYKREFTHTHSADFSKHSPADIFNVFSEALKDPSFDADESVPIVKEISRMISSIGDWVDNYAELVKATRDAYGIFSVGEVVNEPEYLQGVHVGNICRHVVKWMRSGQIIPPALIPIINATAEKIDAWVVKEMEKQHLSGIKFLDANPVMSFVLAATKRPELSFTAKSLNT